MSDSSNSKDEVFLSRKAVGGIPWMFLSKLLFTLPAFGINVLVARYLGSANLGILALCRNVGEYMALIGAMGLDTGLLRFVQELVVKKNKYGLVRLLRNVAFIQTGMVGLLLLAVFLAAPYFEVWLGLDRYLLAITTLFFLARMLKGFVEGNLAALIENKTIAFLTIGLSALWISLTASIVPFYPTADIALLVRSVSIGAVYFVGAFFLYKTIGQIEDNSKREPGIGKRRVLNLAVPVMFNRLLSMSRGRIEILVLGLYLPKEMVGIYFMGYTLPQMVCSTLPITIQSTISSGFAEAYTKDESSLGRLIEFFYRILILIVLPLCVIGVFFGDKAMLYIYGADGQAAGPVASLFFAYYIFSQIAIPHGASVLTKEKVASMTPISLLQVVVNLALAFILIPRYEIYGAIATVFGTLFLVTPIRLYVAAKLVGGLFFPVGFFCKILSLLVAIGFLLKFTLLPYIGNLFFLVCAGVLYVALYVGLIRGLRLVDAEQIEGIQGLGFQKFNKVLAFLVGK